MFKTDTEDMYVSMNFSCSWKLEILWRGVVCDYPGAWGHLGVLWLAEEDKLIVMVPLLLLRHLARLHVGRGGRGATGAATHHPAAAQYQFYQVRWPWSLSTIGIVNIFPWYQKFVFDLLSCIYLKPAAQSWSKACSSIVCLRKYREVYLEKETSFRSSIVKCHWYKNLNSC